MIYLMIFDCACAYDYNTLSVQVQCTVQSLVQYVNLYTFHMSTTSMKIPQQTVLSTTMAYFVCRQIVVNSNQTTRKHLHPPCI